MSISRLCGAREESRPEEARNSADEYVERMVHEYGLVEPLARIIEARVPAALEPAPVANESNGSAPENTQILYGVVSLMRHLAIPRVFLSQILPSTI